MSHDLRTPVHSLLAAADQLREEAPHTCDAALLDTIDTSARELLERLDELLHLSEPHVHLPCAPEQVNLGDFLATELTADFAHQLARRALASVRVNPALDRDVLVAKSSLAALLATLLDALTHGGSTNGAGLEFALGEGTLVIAAVGLSDSPDSHSALQEALSAIEGATCHTNGSTTQISVPVTFLDNRRRGNGRRVLLVDDTAVPRQLGAAMVRSLGYDVDTAEGGLDTIAALQGADYALVLMDVRMPDLDGLATTRAIRAGEAGQGHRAVPIVALTADAVAGGRDEALAAGMDDYVTKPFSRESLARVLTRFIEPADQIAS